ncbi:MAG: YdcF family protein, partial [Rhodospirillales bacterium]
TACLTFLPVGDWIEGPLEQRFPPAVLPETLPGPTGVIVLGGVIDPIATTTSGMPSIGGGAERVIEMLYLARRYPDIPVIYTGGSGRLTDTEHREADAARLLIERIGLDPARFVF